MKIPWRSLVIINFENDDKFCFLWSILASLHACSNNHPNRVSIFIKYFDELDIQGFDFSDVLICYDVHKFEKLNNLSINIFELGFYQDKNEWKLKLIPFEISEDEPDKLIDLSIYKNQYIPL